MTDANVKRSGPRPRRGRAVAAILLYPLLTAGLGLAAGCSGGKEKSVAEECAEEGSHTAQAGDQEEGCADTAQ